MSTFLKLHSFTPVEEKFPLVALHDDGVTSITKSGQYVRIIEVGGRDYSGLNDEILESLFQTRKIFFENLPSNIVVFHQSHRLKLSRDISDDAYSIPLSGLIASEWAKNFKTSYRTRHYLIIATSNDDFVDQLALLSEKKLLGGPDDHSLMVLEDLCSDALVRLNSYGARILSNDEVASYWAWMLNGRHVYQRVPEDRLFDGVLAGTDLLWPTGKPYQVYRGPNERFSAWLIIKSPPTASDSSLLESIYRLHYELSIFQTFSRYDKQKALSNIEDRRKNVLSFLKSTDIMLIELEELEQRVQADDIALMRHRFAVEVFADNPQELDEAVHEVRNTVESWGYRVGRERVNQEALFWSRFPELHNFNPRQRSMTSENAAHFCTFASVGEGFESCSWGQAPVTLFKTVTGSEFSFTFHSSPEKEALGNTIVIGGSNSGKTTLISFLLSQCFKYPNFKVLAFDRLHGLEVFSHFHDGSYLDFIDGIDINPLHLPDTNENRAFLNNWFQILTGKSDDVAQEIINKAITQSYYLERKDRNLVNLMDAFGLKQAGSVRQSLERWLPGNAYGGFFTGEHDALDFSNPLVSIDMTTLLDTPDVLGPMTYYLFHKLFLVARGKGGYVVFVDELPNYLKSEVFAPKIETLLQEVRKTNGVFVTALQDAGTYLKHPIASKIKNNIATYILFPEPGADKEHYIEGIGLNEREFEWIKTPHIRQAMIKRKGAESVIVNVDLAPLKKYLRVFDSGSDSIRKVNEYRGSGNDWKNRYLQD